MGMYTGLRASVIVKPEFRYAISELHAVEWPRWGKVLTTCPRVPGLTEWVKYGCDQIPFGGLSYMPDDFSDAENGEHYSRFDEDSGEWTFCCSLKDYKSEIEFFVENVLRHIIVRAKYCEHIYEVFPSEYTWRQWTTHSLWEVGRPRNEELLTAIRADKNDAVAKMAYADWLSEHGEDISSKGFAWAAQHNLNPELQGDLLCWKEFDIAKGLPISLFDNYGAFETNPDDLYFGRPVPSYRFVVGEFERLFEMLGECL